MGATGYDNCFAGTGRRFAIGRMYANAKSGNVSAFVCDTDVDHADMRGKEAL